MTRVVLVLAVVSLAAAAGASAQSSQPPVSALRTLPPPPTLPTQYVTDIHHTAKLAGISAHTAANRTRLLLSNVTGLPLYAFGGSGHRVCFLVWRGGGTCGVLDAAHDSLWVVNGGSRKRGQAIVGLVPDGIRAVVVSLGSRTIRAKVRHNAFVVPFRASPDMPAPTPSVIAIHR